MKKVFYSSKGYIGKGVAQVVLCDGKGYISGQLSCDLETGKAIHTTMAEQTRNALECIKGIMEDMNLTLDNIVKCNVFISSMDLFNEMNEVYIEYFGTESPPARQTVVAGVWDNLDVEISAEFIY